MCVHVLQDIDEGQLKLVATMEAAYTMKVTTRDSCALVTDIVAVMKCQPDCSIESQPSITTAIYVCMYGYVYMYVCICLYMYIYVRSSFQGCIYKELCLIPHNFGMIGM